MFTSPPSPDFNRNNPGTGQDPHEGSSPATLPDRERLVLESLVDTALVWKIETHKTGQTWESSNINPFAPPPDPFNEIGLRSIHFYHPEPRRPLRMLPHSTGLDWYTVETRTFQTTTEFHKISLIQTHINSFTHFNREGINTLSYRLELADRADPDQKLALCGEEHPELKETFQSLARRIIS